MRAHISTPSRPSAMELDGPYLRAMQEVSVRLMENLPAGDDLWRTLGQVEALLLEAQQQERPLQEIFGHGGLAGFCQSIVDEYRQDGDATAVPAARDKAALRKTSRKEPRGGAVYRKKRRVTALLAVLLSLLVLVGGLWYTGLLTYVVAGSGFYLDELYNFQSTSCETNSGSITLQIPLKQASGLAETLYSDAEGYCITLTGVETYDHAGSFPDPNTGEDTYRRMMGWYLRFSYTVKADFNHISYVEPPSEGTVTVTLADGTTHTGKISWIESGVAQRGEEFARISVIDLPYDTDVRGATLRVVMDSPCRMDWERIRIGRR